MISRDEFKTIAQTWNPTGSLAADNSPLWIREYGMKQSKWFVCVRPIGASPKYWDWCKKNLKGHVLCYASDPTEGMEWWGFTEQEDVAWWMLKWQK